RGSFVQFLRMAQGSLKELETHVLLACRFGMLEKPTRLSCCCDAKRLGK
ncbi:MAG: four helix bundle protein, partial [Mesorhizobium sp.]